VYQIEPVTGERQIRLSPGDRGGFVAGIVPITMSHFDVPVAGLNAIPDLGTARPTFDRTLMVEFLISHPRRRVEAQFERFSARRPRILGALLDAAVAGNRNLARVTLAPPRLGLCPVGECV